MKNWPIILFLVLFSIVATLYSIKVWLELNGTIVSFHGYLAMGLGVVFSFVIGGGLMFLMFYSARKGHDASAYEIIDDDDDDETEKQRMNRCPKIT